MRYPMRAWVATPLGQDDIASGGELIWVSGHNARPEDSSAVAGNASAESFSEQFALAMERLERTLHEAGASWGDLLSVRVYVPQFQDLEGLETRLGGFLCEPFPALTILCSPLRPGLLFEIECVALRPHPNLHVGG